MDVERTRLLHHYVGVVLVKVGPVVLLGNYQLKSEAERIGLAYVFVNALNLHVAYHLARLDCDGVVEDAIVATLNGVALLGHNFNSKGAVEVGFLGSRNGDVEHLVGLLYGILIERIREHDVARTRIIGIVLRTARKSDECSYG